MIRKYIPYLAGLIIIVVMGILLAGSRKNMPKKLDERVTLKKDDKIPYGTAVARQLISNSFPGADISFNRKEPALWNNVEQYGSGQAVFIIADFFNADEYELSRIFDFANNGNYVFIISRTLSYETLKECGFSYYDYSYEHLFQKESDSLWVQLQRPVFTDNKFYVYPGKRHESYFHSLDTARTIVLGRNHSGHPNFLQMNTGEGKVFFHIAPLAFSNYFILHKNNHTYFEQAISVIPSTVNKILWNEYYLSKPRPDREDEPSWLRVLLRYPAFQWGLFTALATIVFFVLMNMRRKQRMIPAYVKPKNESLEFVKTLGRLYYQKKDHLNLAKKMSAYFLDHVRSRYKMVTTSLDDDFSDTLHRKTGYPVGDIKSIVEFIVFLDTAPAISESQLAGFQKKLELFYEKT